jgi:hypothetical protein
VPDQRFVAAGSACGWAAVIIALAGVVVIRLGPAAAVGTLTALAAVLATVPQIIKAVQGRTR